MAALSSMIRMRRLARVAVLRTDGVARRARQLENEGRSASRPIAFRMQRSAQFLGRERAAVQTEAVSGLPCRKAVSEQAVQVLRRDADAMVDDGDPHAVRRGSDPYGQKLIRLARFVAGIFGVAHEI